MCLIVQPTNCLNDSALVYSLSYIFTCIYMYFCIRILHSADGQWVAKDQPEEGEPSKKFREEDASSTQGSERDFE